MKRYLAGGNHNRKTGFQRKRLGRYRSEKKWGQSTAANVVARKEHTAANTVERLWKVSKQTNGALLRDLIKEAE